MIATPKESKKALIIESDLISELSIKQKEVNRVYALPRTDDYRLTLMAAAHARNLVSRELKQFQADNTALLTL
jgi:hypothetical protein